MLHQPDSKTPLLDVSRREEGRKTEAREEEMGRGGAHSLPAVDILRYVQSGCDVRAVLRERERGSEEEKMRGRGEGG